MQDDKDTKLGTKQSSPNLKSGETSDYSIVPVDAHQLVVVYSVFFFLCYLAFSTVKIDFSKDKKGYTRWARFFGVPISRQTVCIPESAKVCIDSKVLLGIRYCEIRINQDGQVLVRRFGNQECAEIGQTIAECLQIEVDDRGQKQIGL